MFDVLNVFRQCWFLNRDHLITNILSTQKDESGHLMWVNFQPTFHTHLVWWALTLVPPLFPIVKGKHCMFMFVLDVLDGDRPGPSEPGLFFALPKKRNRSLPKPKMVSTTPAPSAPPPPPLSGPPPFTPAVAAPSLKVPPLPLKHGNTHVNKSTWDHGVNPGVIAAMMWDASSSPLSTLTPSLVVRPLAPMGHSISPVTLSQVEDILTTRGMVQALHAQINPPPASFSFSSPSAMVMDLDKVSSSSYANATSFNP